MSARLGVWFMGVLAHLPLPVLRALGWALGQVLYLLAAPRRRVALRNLELCFPQEPLRQRRAWARETFVVFCQTWLDRSWLWSAPRAVVERRVQLQGALHELDGDTPTIIFAPHFLGMDAGGLALPLRTERAFTSIFSTHPDPVVDDWFMRLLARLPLSWLRALGWLLGQVLYVLVVPRLTRWMRGFLNPHAKK